MDETTEDEKTSLVIVDQPEDSMSDSEIHDGSDLKERLKNIPEELVTPSSDVRKS